MRGVHFFVVSAGLALGACSNTEPEGEAINFIDVDYARGVFVAVGSDARGIDGAGVILSSTDGERWTPVVTDAPAIFWSVAHSEDRFVAVGSRNGDADQPRIGKAYWSTDGINWQVAEASEPMKAVAWGNGTFVGLGNGIQLSPDGITWRAVGGGGSTIAFNNGTFVRPALTDSDALVLTSTDGETWTEGPSRGLCPHLGRARRRRLSWAAPGGLLVRVREQDRARLLGRRRNVDLR